ncbi:MAG: VOC family protein [Nocardioides sp.]
MAGERTYPILPCADLDRALSFYNALGFAVTYQQRGPNPYAVVELNDIVIHLSGIDGFDAAASYASVVITVDQLAQLYQSFKEGLRAGYGKVPLKGIPRLLQPRRKAGTATGFSVVDVGGNWLRFYATGASEDETHRTGLGRVIDVAARQGDARGDETRALAVLDAGLLRYPDAPAAERDEALAYRAELEERTTQSH